jgi:plastocyanin
VVTSDQVRRIAMACWFCCAFLSFASIAEGQLNTVRAQIEIKKKVSSKPEKGASVAANSSDVVVWLKPLDRPAAETALVEQSRKKFQLVQKDKSFQPHLIVVPVGSVVDFPNRDPFFHNVFSLFDGKRFDLGLYEAGATNSVRFDRLGVSFLFCNIHPEMSAIVVSVDTPYYAVSDHAGNITIPNVPDGKYEIHIWYERSLPEELKALTRILTVSLVNQHLGTINIPENPNFSPTHKNKYGQDYTPPPTPSYSHP